MIERMPKRGGKTIPDVYPCNVCGEPAIACLRPDMDLKGLCFCEEHRDEVYAVYTMIISGDDVEQYVTHWKHK